VTDKDTDVHAIEDPEAQLEQAFIDEYLKLHGHDRDAIRAFPPAELMALLEAASRYATGKLAEFEARAHYVHDLHGKDW
jgi:hypothetical protein